MADADSAETLVEGGSFVERLVCHDQLPLVAGLDATRPAVHIWELGCREIDLDDEQASEHDFAGAPISALAVMSTGQLVVADRSGQLAVTAVPGSTVRSTRLSSSAAARARVDEFLAATTELPDDADLDASLIRHDGQRLWNSADLETVTAAKDCDPTWLRLQAAINTYCQEHDERQPR